MCNFPLNLPIIHNFVLILLIIRNLTVIISFLFLIKHNIINSRLPTSEASHKKAKLKELSNNISDRSEAKGTGIMSDLLLVDGDVSEANEPDTSGKSALYYIIDGISFENFLTSLFSSS